MDIDEIKIKMLNYIDYYGGGLINEYDIMNATTKEQLIDIIRSHRRFMEYMLSDALGSLKSFELTLNLED
jgi:hypothetical protein